MSHPVRTVRAVEHLRKVSHLPGNVVEMGVWTGITTIAMAQYLQGISSNKVIYACDTYAGLPYDGREGIDAGLRKGECDASLNHFWSNIKAAGVRKYVIPIRGMVENTLHAALNDKSFCFAFLDMDLYEPTSFAMKYLHSRIVRGGRVGFHDYKFERCPGIEIVVDKEVDRSRFERVGDTAGNCAWIRRR